jgi:type II secretory pathway predicted ATPase ExeA
MTPISTTSLHTFGLLLKRARHAARLTQEQLGERAGYSAVYISMLERGARQPQHSTVALLAEALTLTSSERAAFETAALLPSPYLPGDWYAGGDATTNVEVSPLPLGGFLGATPTGPLVGRERELAAIATILAGVARGQGRLLVLFGEPGAGKTRLAQEMTLNARVEGFKTITGRCYESQQTIAYYPFFELLAQAVTDIDAAMQARLMERLAESSARLNDGVAQQRLFWEVNGFLETLAARKPLALLLDDLHWADRASLDLLQYLARHCRERRILLVGTTRVVEAQRHEPLAAALSDLRREEIVDWISVRCLEEEETAALISATLGGAVGALGEAMSVSADLAQHVYARSEGNAFVTRHLARALQEQGHVQFAEGQWRLSAENPPLTAPKRIHSKPFPPLGWLTSLTLKVLRRTARRREQAGRRRGDASDGGVWDHS